MVAPVLSVTFDNQMAKGTAFGFQPLGRGTIDIPGVLYALGDAGCEGWATVELAEHNGHPQEPAIASLRYLEPLLAARVAS
jgi:sugar phosphate isomerase/epimerase